ncbi:MAG TPA: hypothetical protein VNT60_03535, partial [Deinococcales bacterium]|nr:hypothetical protein [Deinococcales bacterium]
RATGQAVAWLPHRGAARAVLGAREARLRDGWTPCRTCGAPVREPGHCLPCRSLLESPQVRAAATRLECNPDLALEDPEGLYPGAGVYALNCARELALASLEAQMDRLLPETVSGGHEYLSYLRVLANSYLSLKLSLPMGALGRAERRELPERVRNVLSAAESAGPV